MLARSLLPAAPQSCPTQTPSVRTSDLVLSKALLTGWAEAVGFLTVALTSCEGTHSTGLGVHPECGPARLAPTALGTKEE